MDAISSLLFIVNIFMMCLLVVAVVKRRFKKYWDKQKLKPTMIDNAICGFLRDRGFVVSMKRWCETMKQPAPCSLNNFDHHCCYSSGITFVCVRVRWRRFVAIVMCDGKCVMSIREKGYLKYRISLELESPEFFDKLYHELKFHQDAEFI